MKFNPILIVVALALGLCAGLAFGYFLGAFVWTPRVTNVDYVDLRSTTQDDVIVLIADAYALDGDIAHARERLAQFKDATMPSRVVTLAKKYSASNEPSASSLAALAIALGNSDADIAQLAVTRTPTLTPTPTRTALPSATPTLTPTIAGPTSTTARASATPTRPRTATPTTAPKPAAIAPTEWIPSFPGEWPLGVSYKEVALAVPSGQKYWRLTKAIFCDIKDEHDYCKDMPGGSDGLGVWISLVGSKGPVLLNGTPVNLEDKSDDPGCRCTFSLDFPDGSGIQIGNFPSDTISGLALKSVKEPRPQTHVRYFLTFQLLTK